MVAVVYNSVWDMLIRIKNAYMAKKLVVDGVVYSKFKKNVLEILKTYGYIKDFEIIEEDGNKKFLKIHLKKVTNLRDDRLYIKFYSKPSRRWYVKSKDLKSVANGKGIGLISTSNGLMTTKEAKQKKLGGELIAEIY